MKIWEKEFDINKSIEEFTIGKDFELDMLLAEWDVAGSMAHAIMLESVGLINKKELHDLLKDLRKIYQAIKENKFEIEQG